MTEIRSRYTRHVYIISAVAVQWSHDQLSHTDTPMQLCCNKSLSKIVWFIVQSRAFCKIPYMCTEIFILHKL